MRRQVWIFGLLALLAVWGAAALARRWAASRRPTAEQVVAFAASHSLEGLSAEERRQVLADLAARINRLPFEERQQARFERDMRRYVASMSDEEKFYLMEATLPSGMKHMMQALNRMSPERRQKIVSRAVDDLRAMQDRAPDAEVQDALSRPEVRQAIERISQSGMEAFLSEANASVKMDLQPVLEQLQRIVQGIR